MLSIRSVLVKNSACAYSGALISDKFVLVTSHLINSATKFDGENIETFFVVEKCENNFQFKSREAFLIGSLCDDTIKVILRKCFGDINDYNQNISDIVDLFTIYVLSFNEKSNIDELKKLWSSHMAATNYGCDLKISDEIYIKAAPFGSRQLINSYSGGIISNIISGIILSDCPTALGCEGGVVIAKNKDIPIGVVVSSMAGWRGEWTGLTLAITFEAILSNKTQLSNESIGMQSSQLLRMNMIDKVINSLVYVKSGSSWGTGICVDKQKRLILTNAHVITHDANVKVIFRDVSSEARIIFKAPDNEQFDLAVLQCDDLTSFHSLQNVTFRCDALEVGETVYTLGFPLFAHTTQMLPTMTRGHVSLVKKDVVMTTCAVLPGASGGALCDFKGQLVGVVTCNIMNTAEGLSYPRVNMNIPVHSILPVLRRYIQSDDETVLNELILDDDRKSDWAISKL